jgi:EAL domain-containing protein (putative c-di-GMP-specific phosphodiesterase class I)/GGDEF domain-containing protein
MQDADKRSQAARAPGKVLAPEDLVAFLQSKLALSQEAGSITALLMLELRRSDRLGALVGDPQSQELLRKILARLDGLLRPDDRLAAVTYDEIWLVLPDLPHHQLAVLAANRILDARELRNAAAMCGFAIRPCVGIACFPDHAVDLRGLIEAADIARRAAAASEDHYAVSRLPQTSPLLAPEFERELIDAIKANALELHYQPQIDLRSGQCHSAEALIRWSRMDGEQVPAALIADVAERGEALHSLTIFVLNTALRHAVDFRRDGCDVRVSVNLSAKLVSDDELPALVAQLLDAWSVPSGQISLEVTESSIVQDVERSAEILKNLKNLGVRLAMDDFGTGYSSLAHLRLFPFDEIKIDQIFAKNILRSGADEQIVRAMIDLGHDFGMEVVAEGVEDLPTLRRLKELNCDFVQGYVVAKAMPLRTFREWWGSPHDFFSE